MQREPLATQLRTLAAALAGRGKVKAAAAADGLQASLRTADAATAFALAWEALFTKEGEPRQQLGQHPLLQTVQDELQAIHHMRRQQAAHSLRRVVAAFLGLMALAYGVGETLARLGGLRVHDCPVPIPSHL